MSLQQIIQDAVDTAFSAVGDLKETFTYRDPNGTKNNTGGSITRTPTDTPDCVGIFSQYTMTEEDTDVRPEDERLVFPKKYLTGAPLIGHQIVRGTKVQRIMSPIKGGTGQSVWILHLRDV